MYADVVVLTYQSPEIGIYTYQIPSELKNSITVGHLVEVPFGSRAPYGIVIAIKSVDPKNITKIRPIIGLALPQPVLLPYQIELLKWMANYYAAPLVNCLETMLPQIPRRSLNAKSLTTNAVANEKSVSHSSLSISQTLVLVPSINRLPETLAQFKQAKNYVLFHNQLKTSEIFATWMKIASGDADFIFGSRSAIFAPCPNLAKIIIFDEHDGAYKDERSPYFDTLTVAEKIQELTKAKLEIIDSSPKITTYFAHKNEVKMSNVPAIGGSASGGKGHFSQENSLKASMSPIRQAQAFGSEAQARRGDPESIEGSKIILVSMTDERNAGNKSPISGMLSDFLKRNYRAGGKSLLFLNKKIESGQYFCRNCKHQSYARVKPATCPNCNSQDLFFYSLNIASLANLVRQIIPHVPIKLIAEGISPALAQAPVHIATSTIFYAQNVAKYQFVAHIAPDNVLNAPDFTSAEKVYTQVAGLKKLLAKNGILLLQTYNPQNTTLKSAANNDYQNFAKDQLDLRKALTYPPYALLVKLTIKGNNLEKLSQKAQSIFSLLSESKNDTTMILGPYQSFFTQRNPRYNIILKKKIDSFDLVDREKALADLKPILAKINPDWQIIVDPDTLN